MCTAKEPKKSPVVALIWAAGLPGFGQIYNRDYIWVFTLMVWEIIINLKSRLNLSIYYTGQLESAKADDIFNFEWGLFYPSVYAFSMWQAYNYARTQNGKSKPHLTGFFAGMFAGMDLSMILPFSWKAHTPFASPIITGILAGILGGVIGHLIEKMVSSHFSKEAH